MTNPIFPVPPVGGEGNPLGINDEGDAADREGRRADEESEEPTVITLEDEEKADEGRPDDN